MRAVPCTHPPRHRQDESTPIRHLAGSQQLHASLPRHVGWLTPACSFRMVGLIVDVSPCAPVTKEAEGLLESRRDERREEEREKETQKERKKKKQRVKEKERREGDAHFAFPTCCSVQTSCIACSPIRQSEGNGISQGWDETREGGEPGRETDRGMIAEPRPRDGNYWGLA